MQPPVRVLFSDLAASLLEYRFERLAGARAKAASYAPPYGGAMFPWESALTGQETCPSWAPTGLREIHINGDIAIAVWDFWRSIQDDGNAWMTSVGYPLLSGIADFWMSKLAIDNPGSDGLAGSGPLHLLNVIPPDEYHDHVDDSVYTNVGARLSLSFAAAAAQALGRPFAEYADWLNASSRIVVLFNASAPGLPAGAGGMHPEYAGYLNDTIKQADVVILPLLRAPSDLGAGNWTPASIRNDLDWYARVTDPNGPAMTWGVFAGGYAQLGDAATAATFVNRSFSLNMAPPFSVWFETPGMGGTPGFLTGAGGFLQVPSIMYPQLRVDDGAMTINPQLIDGASIATLRGVSYLGARLDITYTAAAVTMTVQSTSSSGSGSGSGSGAGSETETAASELVDERAEAVYAEHGRRKYACPCATAAAGVARHSCRQHVSDLASAHAEDVASGDAALTLLPRVPLSLRSQRGQVALRGGYRIATRALEVVDASGSVYALTPGQPVTLPVQLLIIQAA